MEKLGLKLQILGLAVLGQIYREKGQTFLDELIEKIKMTPVGDMFVQVFPHPDADPSIVGEVLAQPITIAQPLMFKTLAESFSFTLPGIIPIDTWPELLDGKGGNYIVVASCRDFDPSDVIEVVKSHGLEIVDSSQMILRLA